MKGIDAILKKLSDFRFILYYYTNFAPREIKRSGAPLAWVQWVPWNPSIFKEGFLNPSVLGALQ